jgi:short-subunit dehydrogenase
VNNHRQHTALITGASSGIGYELAQIFAREGYQLILVARNQDALDKLAAELKERYQLAVKVLPKDLAQPNAAQEIYAKLQREAIEIDVLVNNAGFIVHGAFHETDWERERQLIQVNLTTPTQLAKLFGRDMLKRGFGRILNVGSTGSFVPGPLEAVYCASKAYLLSLSEALSKEFESAGVTVTALCPGATRTGFQKAGQIEGVRLLNSGMLDARRVAEAGYRGLLAGKRVVIPGWSSRLQVWAAKVLPRSLVLSIAQNAMERPTTH